MGGISNTLALVHLVLPLLELVPTLGQTPTRIPLGVLVPDSSSPLKQIIESEFEKFNGTSTSLFKFDIQRLGSGYSVDVANATRSMCSMVSSGILAMIGMTDGDVDHMVNDVADSYNIPYVNLNGPHSPPPSGESDGVSHPYTVYIRPPFEKAISDFILFNQSKWTKIFYIFDNSAGFSRMYRLIERIRNVPRKLEVKPVLFKDHSQKKLREFDSGESDGASRFVLLDLSTASALKTALSQLSAFGKDSSNYHYLISGSFLAELDLDDVKRNGAKITGFNLIKRTENGERFNLRNKSQIDSALARDAVAVVTRGLNEWHSYTEAEEVQEILRHFENPKHASSQCDQIPTTPWQIGAAILNALKQVDFYGETGRVVFDALGHRDDYELGFYELNSSRSQPEEVAIWDPKQGFKLKSAFDEEQATTVDRSNSSKTIIVTTILSHPFLKYKKRSDSSRRLTGNDRYEGYLADLTRLLLRIVGFEYELRLVKDGRYGMKNPDGTWNGMIGELMRGEADVAIAPLTITSIRERVVDFSRPYMTLGISIMIEKSEKHQMSFFDVLSLGTWAAILFTYLVVCLFYCFVDRFTRGICKQTNSNMAGSAETFNNSTSWSSWTFGIICRLFIVSLFAVLTAQISKFNFTRQLSPIESVDDLVKQQEIMYGTLDAGSTKDFFRHSKIRIYEQMWNYMSANPDVFVKTTEEGVQRVRASKGRYAFLLESTMNDFYNQIKPCETMKIGDNLDTKSYGLAFPIGSALRDRMDLAIQTLIENGSLAKLKQKWWYDKGECQVEKETSDVLRPLSNVNDLAGLFYTLFGGLVLSVVVLLIESRFFKSRTNMNQLKRKD